ncbi:alanine racemase [Acidiluteibacter ferrifornacis]|uniref:Alanine racemase n=1 Tax=Acidiluteibacter ferrifornacis TaxID=2692424 RepID=A0A6N9NRP6_9FLAO|nr:alanine racemase [Acidiluteibacter ferrifornacis]NBG67095.1 alanine racemase [Acidiluteibacter ferrifornacis]
MFQTSYIELSQSALEENYKFLKSVVGEQTLISTVIKGNAYGHGIVDLVPMAIKAGQTHFSVFSADEARLCREVAPNAEIMIMGMLDNEELEWAITNNIQFYIFEVNRLEEALKIAKKLNQLAQIHLELETGMNRTGLRKKEVLKVIELLNQNENYILKGICTHFAGAESIGNYVRIQEQIKSFKKQRKQLAKEGLIAECYHTASSAATLSYPKTQMDMVRIGILNYGFWPSTETFIHYVKDKSDRTDPLRRILSWKSKVMSTKTVETGEFIGYGTTYMARENMKIATVPVGYSHGYSRSLSNQGRVLVNGERVSVVGIVNMNMMVLDITDIPDTKKGDEVVLIGNQGDYSISVSSFSELSDQLNYELLTRLPHNIPRKVIK